MSCSNCKSNNQVNNVKWSVLILGFYILVTSIYGTLQIVKNLIDYFK